MIHTAEGKGLAHVSERSSAGGYPAYSIHVSTGEPDALSERAVAAGANVVRKVEDSPVGTRGFIVSDPEGLYWGFGTPLPALERDEGGHWRPPSDASAPAAAT
jgi:uncharacterized glyoxalase superfamily protein PhnB